MSESTMNDAAVRRLPYAALIAGLLVVMYWNFAGIIWGKWFEESSYYSHGLLIPAVTIYLIWRLVVKGEFSSLPARSSKLGLAVLLFGAFLRVLGAYMEVNYISGFSFVVLLVGMTLYVFGWQITWKLLFPLLFLIWMVPLPANAIIKISYALKMFASKVTVLVLPYLSFSFLGLKNLKFLHLEGSTLTFLRPDYSFDSVMIDDVCSGLRSMIALLAFGSLFAYITSASTRKRLELFAASVPCSIVANMSRIVVITIVAYFGGAKFATVDKIIPNPFGEAMTIHDVTGLVIFIVAFIAFFSYEKLLNQFPLKLPKANGPKKWLYEFNGKTVKLAENQLETLIRSGHISPDDRVRQKDSPQWQQAKEIPQFAESPRHRKLKIEGIEEPMTFAQCQQAARESRISRTDFIRYADGNAQTMAGNLDFLRLYWPTTLTKKLSYVLLYGALPVALFFVVRASSFLSSFAQDRPGGEGADSVLLGQILVTIVLWFVVRTALLLGSIVIKHLKAPEKPMPAPAENPA